MVTSPSDNEIEDVAKKSNDATLGTLGLLMCFIASVYITLWKCGSFNDLAEEFNLCCSTHLRSAS